MRCSACTAAAGRAASAPSPPRRPSPSTHSRPAGVGLADEAVVLHATTAIRVQHLSHRFGSSEVLHDIGFEVGEGEIFGFIGPNGAGKTTTIRAMATLLEPSAGRIEIGGVDV